LIVVELGANAAADPQTRVPQARSSPARRREPVRH